MVTDFKESTSTFKPLDYNLNRNSSSKSMVLKLMMVKLKCVDKTTHVSTDNYFSCVSFFKCANLSAMAFHTSPSGAEGRIHDPTTSPRRLRASCMQ